MLAMAQDFTEEPESAWSVDNRKGREQADALVALMRANGAPNLLGPAIKEIVNRGVYGGVEVGFCNRLAERLIR